MTAIASRDGLCETSTRCASGNTLARKACSLAGSHAGRPSRGFAPAAGAEARQSATQGTSARWSIDESGVGRVVQLPRRLEVVARDEGRAERARTLVRDVVPHLAREHGWVVAGAVVARRHDGRVTAMCEHALDRARVELRAVGEHDERS